MHVLYTQALSLFEHVGLCRQPTGGSVVLRMKTLVQHIDRWCADVLRYFVPLRELFSKGSAAAQGKMIRCGSCCCTRRCPSPSPSGRPPAPRSMRCCSRTSHAPVFPLETWQPTSAPSFSRALASCRSGNMPLQPTCMTWLACFTDTDSAKPERIYQKHVTYQQFEAWPRFADGHLCFALIKVVPVCTLCEC